MRTIIVALFAALLMAASMPSAAQDVPAISEAEIDMRARDVGRSLRCVVCQNQSIEESDASLAEDMRTIVRARIRKGESNEQVIAYMQSRYGDFVLLEPPVQKNTYILWALPFVLVLLALLWFWRAARRNTSSKTL